MFVVSTMTSNSRKPIVDIDLINTNVCLIHGLIIIYDSTIWCIQVVYELFFQSFWQIIMYIRQELHDRRLQTTKTTDNMTSLAYQHIKHNRYRSRAYPSMSTNRSSINEKNSESTVHGNRE
jgi:hypothetical protein